MTPWTPATVDRHTPTPLSDSDIVAIGLATMKRYRPLGVSVSSRITAARLARLTARRAS